MLLPYRSRQNTTEQVLLSLRSVVFELCLSYAFPARSPAGISQHTLCIAAVAAGCCLLTPRTCKLLQLCIPAAAAAACCLPGHRRF
jgi:hypothetical protein